MSEVTQAQQAVRDFCLEVFESSGYEKAVSYDFTSTIKSDEAYRKISELAVGSLLLPMGASLSNHDSESSNNRDLGILLSSVEPNNVNIRVYNELFGSPEEADETKDWDNELIVELWYHNNRVAQRLGAYASSSLGPVTPSVERDVWAFDYAGKDYNGHSRVKSYSFADEDVIRFVNLARTFAQNKA